MKKRILTGDTPTGRLHLGHYVGTLQNRVKLQHEYETFIILADLHSLTTLAEKSKTIAQYTYEVALDNLSVGIEPKVSTIFIESEIPEIYELAAIFSMLVSHSRALRNPTIKDEIKIKGLGDTYSLGFVNYPLYQVADILCVRGELVPVGVDQVPHVEQTKEVVRKFNSLYGNTFPVPQALVGKTGKLVGIDGSTKMSKSLNNAIYLSDSKEEIEDKVMRMYTDPTRIHPTDKGHVERNPVFIYHDLFNLDKEEVKELKERYTQGKVTDIEVKKKLIKALNIFLEPVREKRAFYEQKPGLVEEILKEGSEKTRIEARKTLALVKEKMGLISF